LSINKIHEIEKIKSCELDNSTYHTVKYNIVLTKNFMLTLLKVQ